MGGVLLLTRPVFPKETFSLVLFPALGASIYAISIFSLIGFQLITDVQKAVKGIFSK
jgi:hypothetical protein